MREGGPDSEGWWERQEIETGYRLHEVRKTLDDLRANLPRGRAERAPAWRGRTLPLIVSPAALEAFREEDPRLCEPATVRRMVEGFSQRCRETLADTAERVPAAWTDFVRTGLALGAASPHWATIMEELWLVRETPSVLHRYAGLCLDLLESTRSERMTEADVRMYALFMMIATDREIPPGAEVARFVPSAKTGTRATPEREPARARHARWLGVVYERLRGRKNPA